VASLHCKNGCPRSQNKIPSSKFDCNHWELFLGEHSAVVDTYHWFQWTCTATHLFTPNLFIEHGFLSNFWWKKYKAQDERCVISGEKVSPIPANVRYTELLSFGWIYRKCSAFACIAHALLQIEQKFPNKLALLEKKIEIVTSARLGSETRPDHFLRLALYSEEIEVIGRHNFHSFWWKRNIW